MAINIADKAKWEKAISKAKTEKPHVKALEFGKYQVCGKGGCYTVTWSGKGSEMQAECDCPAGKKGRPCYHIPATSGAFKLSVIERAKARTCSDCPAPALDGEALCNDCLQASEESRLEQTAPSLYTLTCKKCSADFQTTNRSNLYCSSCWQVEFLKHSADLFGQAA